MEIVYGSRPKEEAFLDQTYLVTLVKLIVYYRLSGDNLVRADQIKRALTGEYFQSYGILNLMEEDFFTWILHPKIADRALVLTCNLAKELLRYDMSQIDEDLFKEIYQEIVKRSERHRIGEYYTPEWLVELTLKEALNIWSERNKDKEAPRILDPACGSGTFLCNAIHMVRNILEKRGKQPTEILDFILNGIVGIDVNPLAVTIARANYLIALGELLRLGRSIIIPVYVSDSIRLPKVRTILSMVQVYEVSVNGYKIQVPSEIAKHRYKLGRILDGLREALNIYRLRGDKGEARALFDRIASEIASQAELEVLNATLDTLLELVDRQLDEIWVYMLNNVYAPIALKEAKFDILTSNPPWIAMRYIENKNYQDWLKQAVFSYQLLSTDQVALFSNMEIATLFFNYCADIYLPAKDGLIAFVMPRSVLTGALHHVKFRRFRKPELKLIKIIDCEDVSPLFNVPSCVLIAIKGEQTTYPVTARRIKGRLERRNMKLSQIYELLRLEDYEYEPPAISLAKKSWYYDKLKTGAWLAPRNMWFIDFIVHPSLGINTRQPFVCSSREVISGVKERWKGIKLQGNVESNFVYATLLSKDLTPFSFIKLRPVIVPIENTPVGYRLLDVSSLRRRGFAGIARWLEKCETLWKERTSERSRERFSSILDRLDYNSLLTKQNPTKRFVLLYGGSGTNIVSCVVDKFNIPSFQINNIKIKPRGFIVDVTTWYYESDDENEVNYLCSVLNSNVTNELIKPIQTKGLFGERHIHRRPFILPIPKFDRSNPIHLRLAELSKSCHDKVAKIKFTKKSIAGRRKEAREVVKDELKEIDDLVSKLLGLG
ncbi:hypothetical protein DRO64_00460 [Candidatus Bathyarchaeota archaeon]|nr:MAG: hypothetical protein DRO64_00460 [Candidatus Bathyarchaeota archaeon]